jgi:hypothetical protein
VIAIESMPVTFTYSRQKIIREELSGGAHCAPPRKLASPSSWATHSTAFDRLAGRKASTLSPIVAGVGRLVVRERT